MRYRLRNYLLDECIIANALADILKKTRRFGPITGNTEVSWSQVPAKSGYRQVRLLLPLTIPDCGSIDSVEADCQRHAKEPLNTEHFLANLLAKLVIPSIG